MGVNKGVGSRVATNVIRTDTEICDFEAFNAVHIEALVEYAVLDNTIALSRRH
jgi:hypothetical protein